MVQRRATRLSSIIPALPTVNDMLEDRILSNEPGIPSTARCLSCGYLLRGLPSPVCPECGRAFNPSDPTSYDVRPPGRRRRKWIAGAVFVVFLLIAVGPRGVLTGKLTFTCTVCGDQTTFYRFEPKPPRWIPFRYPGISWTFKENHSKERGLTSCSVHPNLSVGVQLDMHSGGWVSGSGTAGAGRVLTLNGLLTTVETAPEVLEHLMNPLNNGIQVGPSLVP